MDELERCLRACELSFRPGDDDELAKVDVAEQFRIEQQLIRRRSPASVPCAAVPKWSNDDDMPFSHSIKVEEEKPPPPPADGADDVLCLVCETKPRQYGFVHEEQVCVMVCVDCRGNDFKKTCPWCRKHYIALVRVHGGGSGGK
jgi:hypothetical protein